MFVRSIDFNKLDDYNAIQALRSVYESLRSVYNYGGGIDSFTIYSEGKLVGKDSSVSLLGALEICAKSDGMTIVRFVFEPNCDSCPAETDCFVLRGSNVGSGVSSIQDLRDLYLKCKSLSSVNMSIGISNYIRFCRTSGLDYESSLSGLGTSGRFCLFWMPGGLSINSFVDDFDYGSDVFSLSDILDGTDFVSDGQVDISFLVSSMYSADLFRDLCVRLRNNYSSFLQGSDRKFTSRYVLNILVDDLGVLVNMLEFQFKIKCSIISKVLSFLTDTVCYSDFHYIGVGEKSLSFRYRGFYISFNVSSGVYIRHMSGLFLHLSNVDVEKVFGGLFYYVMYSKLLGGE